LRCCRNINEDSQYRHIKPSEVSNPLIEHDIFVCESTAYRRLKESGLCDKGYIPNFYGTIQQIQPKFWKPHLDMFLEHDLLPNAVLLEYVSDMQMIDLSTFSTERIQKLFHILREIHNAKVLHHDPYPRNMMVVPGEPDRVLWIDFDRAQTFPKPLTQRQQGWFTEEVEFVELFAKALVSSCCSKAACCPDRVHCRQRITKKRDPMNPVAITSKE
jgi:Lipopolysaccharide kinase (Kdo/WaaP) family